MLEIYIPRSWPKDTFRGGGFNLRVQEGLISGEILGNFVNFCVKEEESGLNISDNRRGRGFRNFIEIIFFFCV